MYVKYYKNVWCIAERGTKYPFPIYQYFSLVGKEGKIFRKEFSLSSGKLALIHPMCISLSMAAYYYPGTTPTAEQIFDGQTDAPISLRFSPKATTSAKKPFYLTVGQQYRDISHPQDLHPDSYVKIYAENLQEARQIAISSFEHKWSFIYDEISFDETYFPDGVYLTIGDP